MTSHPTCWWKPGWQEKEKEETHLLTHRRHSGKAGATHCSYSLHYDHMLGKGLGWVNSENIVPPKCFNIRSQARLAWHMMCTQLGGTLGKGSSSPIYPWATISNLRVAVSLGYSSTFGGERGLGKGVSCSVQDLTKNSWTASCGTSIRWWWQQPKLQDRFFGTLTKLSTFICLFLRQGDSNWLFWPQSETTSLTSGTFERCHLGRKDELFMIDGMRV